MSQRALFHLGKNRGTSFPTWREECCSFAFVHVRSCALGSSVAGRVGSEQPSPPRHGSYSRSPRGRVADAQSTELPACSNSRVNYGSFWDFQLPWTSLSLSGRLEGRRVGSAAHLAQDRLWRGDFLPPFQPTKVPRRSEHTPPLPRGPRSDSRRNPRRVGVISRRRVRVQPGWRALSGSQVGAVRSSAAEGQSRGPGGRREEEEEDERQAQILEQIVSSKKQQEEEEKKCRLDWRTPAQAAYEKMQKKRQMEQILKKASKTQKHRVEEFNRHLDTLTEHYNIPKVSWTK